MLSIHVLLIEDNPDDVYLIQRLLLKSQSPSFYLNIVPLLSAGLATLRNQSVDIVLLDLGLPDSHGLEGLHRIQDTVPKVPIIVLTGLQDENLGIEAVQQGSQDYLVKGEVDSYLLTRAIQYAIQRKRIEEELREHRNRLEELVEERTADLRQMNQQLQQEIIEREEAETRALELAVERERMRVLAEFVRDASHDFRTPLSTINTSLYLLQHVKNAEKQQHLIQVIERQVGRLARLVEGLLTMTRLDSSLNFNRVPLDVNGLILDVKSHLQPAAAAKNISLEVELTEDIPLVLADETELSRAITEITQNAVQYTPEHGQVCIASRLNGSSLSLEIRDTGIGIEQADLPHIFERLYRADKARSTDTGGVGLGLPIAQRIIEAHGGRIEVSSQVGIGTSFKIYLPTLQG